MKRSLVGFTLAVVVGSYSLSAEAYNNREHQRLPDQAVQVMNMLRRGDHLSRKVSELTGVSVASLAVRPASVPASQQAQWDRFIREAREAPFALGQLRTGLPDPRRASSECGNAYPVLASGQHLAQCRASELSFAVKRGWATNDSDCFLRSSYFAGDANVPEFFDELPTDFTGALLGYHGQQVDDEVRDTMLWIRYSNMAFVSEFKVLLEDVSQFGLAVAFAPLACLASLFSGDNCFDSAASFAHDIDPITTIDEKAADIERAFSNSLPGATSLDGDDGVSTTGLWHFINVEKGDGYFNSIGGMHYTQGGWRGSVVSGPAGIGRIDGLDYAIIAGADLLGLTLDPDLANGVKRYQQSPDGHLNRRKGDWLLTIGHTEFEPLDNLALYGWRRFLRDHDASGLGWPLHALGDAVAPHHGIAATGWGHRPYEDFAGYAWREMFSEGGSNHYFSIQQSLVHAFNWWVFIDNFQRSNPNDIPIREMVTNLAFETRLGSDWALHNGISLGYSDGDEADARANYESDKDKVKDLLERGTGATMAFLIKAARLAVPDSSASPCACSPGTARGVRAAGGDPSTCRPCSSVNQVEVDGQCRPSCPLDRPLLTPAGSCVATCPAGTSCTGVACPNPADFVQGGSCVATCSAQAPFAVGRECRASCPADMVATDTTPRFCQTDPHCRTTTGTRTNDGTCDEHCAPGFGFIFNHICVAQCPQSDRFFVIEAGLGNCLASCPAARPMSVVTTGPTECLAVCPSSAAFFVFGQRDCLTSCPVTVPFHADGSFSCLTSCPVGMPFRTPGSFTCLTNCPQNTPFWQSSDRICRPSCPSGTSVSANNECIDVPR